MIEKEPYIKVTKNGPYLVFGITKLEQKLILADDDGFSIGYGDGRTFEIKPDKPLALCRCGRSKNAPFCDAEHVKPERFEGCETAGFACFADEAMVIEGPDVTLLDHRKLCALARFCDAEGEIWSLVETGGGEATRQAICEADLCPSGRLVILDKEGRTLESKLPPGVSLLEDVALEISGPIWVTGGIRVECEGGQCYEVRMKQTLCRCGRSGNKPFCDGAHASEPGWCAHYPAAD